MFHLQTNNNARYVKLNYQINILTIGLIILTNSTAQLVLSLITKNRKETLDIK